MSRRGFLAAGCAAACAGAAGVLGAPRIVRAQDAAKPKIKIIYSLHEVVQARPDWPNVGFDFGPVMERINGELAQGCPGFEFVTAMANGEEEAKKVIADDGAANIDGYIVYQMNCWNKVVQTVAATGKPVLYADLQFAGSGGFLVYTAGFLRAAAPNVGFVASSRPEDLIAAAQSFALVKQGGTLADFVAAVTKVRIEGTPKPGELACLPDPLQALSAEDCMARMKEMKILAVRSQESGEEPAIMGIPVIKVPFAELNDAWSSANKDEAAAIADRWLKTAVITKDVPREVMDQSAAMYLAEKAILSKYGANAITINCLGGFYGGHIHAYPCLGFYELNNEGLVGGCECDTRSAACMAAFGALANGRPGYISDPVIDTSKRQIIYAHCVASSKPFGPEGATNPVEILTHSEDRQGASVRSILPLGYMTTTVEVAPDRKEILFHQAKAVANDPDDRACRTKICGEPVGDIEKLFTEWDRWGWHRVTVYGDLKEPVFALADALGYTVVQEA
ncbi:MAG: hypothetical protein IT364_06120 [Candidatus Hydrogenedentes bacterium]|nr:hypothetical protein [Candidatus Hydrogenedentota bacterium]